MFSVVIPLYNKQDYILDTITSALEQTFPPSEVIVVDDGSTDGGIEIVRKLGDARIRVISTDHPRSGPSAARNLGVQSAANHWIAFLDADDIWSEDYLFTVNDRIAASSSVEDLVCVFSSYLVKKNDSLARTRLGERLTDPFDVDFTAFVELWVSEKWCPMWTSAVVVAKAAFIKSGGFPEAYRRGEDKVAWLRVMRQGRGTYNPAALAIYNMDVSGQETAGYANDRHAVCVEISSFINTLPAHSRRNLERLYNLQIIRYARDIALREPLSSNLTRGFYVARNPIWFFVIKVLEAAPAWMLKGRKSQVSVAH